MHRGHHALSNKNGKNVDRNVPMRNSSHGSLDDSIHCARGRSETKKRIHYTKHRRARRPTLPLSTRGVQPKIKKRHDCSSLPDFYERAAWYRYLTWRSLRRSSKVLQYFFQDDTFFDISE
uniref:Uncharacterized protein n=1 Tax=Rhizophagus irregularis (strain DAOM 181602 / DAOM 197198 / MUCL 43194) TaxID=747089 RepID=U9TED0_RHIID